jgi:hypothetical protein
VQHGDGVVDRHLLTLAPGGGAIKRELQQLSCNLG